MVRGWRKMSCKCQCDLLTWLVMLPGLRRGAETVIKWKTEICLNSRLPIIGKPKDFCKCAGLSIRGARRQGHLKHHGPNRSHYHHQCAGPAVCRPAGLHAGGFPDAAEPGPSRGPRSGWPGLGVQRGVRGVQPPVPALCGGRCAVSVHVCVVLSAAAAWRCGAPNMIAALRMCFRV